MRRRRARASYPPDAGHDEWGLIAPYQTVVSDDAVQRRLALRERLDAPRWVVAITQDTQLRIHRGAPSAGRSACPPKRLVGGRHEALKSRFFRGHMCCNTSVL